MNLEEVAQKVARKVSPSPREAEEEKKFAQDLIQKLQPALKEARLVLVGSTARDTGLHGDKDIDVFACFPERFDEDHIVRRTSIAVKRALRADWRMHYAEHPYFQARVGKYRVEVIPCFEAQPHRKIKSAVDRSPLHMDFLQKHLSEKQRQDVRALKQLLKTHGLYGAEAHVKGFSGILCEYLILYYGSFVSLAQHAKDWKAPVRIDLAKSSKKFDAPLTFIDAVDVNRNVAAIVSNTQLHRFISLAQALGKKPSEKLFFHQHLTQTSLKKRLAERGTKVFLIELKKPEVVEDILLPQLERTTKNLEKQLVLHDFRVFSSTFFVDDSRAFIFLELEDDELCRVKKVVGPPASHAEAVEQFVQGKQRALRGPFVEEERVVVEEPRRFTSVRALLKEAEKNPVRFGVASRLQKPFRAARVHESIPEKYAPFLTQHVFKKEIWF